jgi:hypothetical protein
MTSCWLGAATNLPPDLTPAEVTIMINNQATVRC